MHNPDDDQRIDDRMTDADNEDNDDRQQAEQDRRDIRDLDDDRRDDDSW